MTDQERRSKRIQDKLQLDKLPSRLQKIDISELGSEISKFIHHVFAERIKSESLNWCFANIKRVKIFLEIFHANQSGAEIYKEEIAKKLPEYSYKTIAKIIDDGISKKYYILLASDGTVGRDTKVKNIRPSEDLMVDFLNLAIETASYIDSKKHKSKS